MIILAGVAGGGLVVLGFSMLCYRYILNTFLRARPTQMFFIFLLRKSPNDNMIPFQNNVHWPWLLHMFITESIGNHIKAVSTPDRLAVLLIDVSKLCLSKKHVYPKNMYHML